MRKVFKWTLILGVVSCLVGIGIITAGGMMGGMGELNSYLDANWHSINGVEDYMDHYVEDYGERHWEPEHLKHEAGSSIPVSQASGGVYENIRRLEIEAGPGNTIELIEEERAGQLYDTVRIERAASDGVRRYNCRAEGADLKIELPEDRSVSGIADEGGMEQLTIYVRAGYRFEKVEVESRAGRFDAETVNADQLSLDTEAGEIEIRGGRIGRLEADCKAGDIRCYAAAENGAEADCEAGTMEILMAGKQNEYDYQLESNVGSIQLLGPLTEEYTGLKTEKLIDNHAGRNVELDCSAGSIAVHFSDTIQ